jgi:pSer/pThr/pTyr-binding forkhead associated (FHA) protein
MGAMPTMPGSQETQRARLLIAAGPRAGTLFPLIFGETLVGRIDSAQLVLEDSTVSRLHARLSLRRDGVWIEDLGSREGTWINGVVVRRKRLNEGDRIAFGDVLLVFERG